MKKIVTGAFLWLLTACNCPYTSYGPERFEQLLESDPQVQLVDVRTDEEYADGAISGAVNIDVKQVYFTHRADSLLDTSRPVAVYCKGGVRSRKAAEALVKKGYTVYNLDKGYDSWLEYREKTHPQKE